jgi:ABC-type sugar transport system permease subunit
MSICAMDIWKTIGFAVVIFLAGLLNIPATYYENARIDGANSLQIFGKITLPLLAPTTFFVCVITFIQSFQVFVPIKVMTGLAGHSAGGPGTSTQVLGLRVYDEGIMMGRYGYAATIALIIFIVIFAVNTIQRALFKRSDY